MTPPLVAAAIIPLVAGGAALFRLRGSSTWREWTGRGVTTIRLIWAAYLAFAAWLVDNAPAEDWGSPLPLLIVALAVALWLGSIAGWWGSLDMGTREGTLAGDMALHSLRGVLWTGPAAMVVVLAGLGTPWPLLAAGALCGPIYAIAGATEPAEWTFGAAMALALLESVALA